MDVCAAREGRPRFSRGELVADGWTVRPWPGEGQAKSVTLEKEGFVLTMGLLFVALNLLVDLLYVLVDPRVTIES